MRSLDQFIMNLKRSKEAKLLKDSYILYLSEAPLTKRSFNKQPKRSGYTKGLHCLRIKKAKLSKRFSLHLTKGEAATYEAKLLHFSAELKLSESKQLLGRAPTYSSRRQQESWCPGGQKRSLSSPSWFYSRILAKSSREGKRTKSFSNTICRSKFSI